MSYWQENIYTLIHIEVSIIFFSVDRNRTEENITSTGKDATRLERNLPKYIRHI
jgi:hypothetical protein